MRVLIGLVLLISSPITLLPSLLVWAITERVYLWEVFEWCIFGDDD
jgi:hypothetical protein